MRWMTPSQPSFVQSCAAAASLILYSCMLTRFTPDILCLHALDDGLAALFRAELCCRCVSDALLILLRLVYARLELLRQ